MANLGDLIGQLEKLTVDLRSSADQTKLTDVPENSGKKLEDVIIKLQGIKGDVGGGKADMIIKY